MRHGYLVGIGSNIDPARNVGAALETLLDRFGQLEISSILETAPSPGLKGPFLNAVIYLQSDLSREHLKAEFCRIETALGRDRTDPNRALKDRTVDLDILLQVSEHSRHLAPEGITEESYYRPSLLELVKTMGWACSAPFRPVQNTAAISTAGGCVGLKPVRLSAAGSAGTSPLLQVRRAALVTGAAVRLGNAIATTLASAGYDIALHYKSSHERAERAAERFRALGVQCALFPYDLSTASGIPGLLDSVIDRFPHLDVLVNSASVYGNGRISETTPEMLEQQWSVNFRAPFFLTKEFAGRVAAGSVINLIDNKIAFNQFHYAAYLGSKKALAELTRMAALEFAPRIRVNGIAPGVVLPPPHRAPSYLHWRKQAIPTQTLGNPAHVCGMVETLVRNEFINGQILFVDGGESVNIVGRNFESFAEPSSELIDDNLPSVPEGLSSWAA